MHARVTTFKIKPGQADAGARIFQEGIPAIRDLKGFKDAVLLVDRAAGTAMTIALWENEHALRDSAAAAGHLFQQAAHTIDGTPERAVYEVGEHRAGQNRMFARVSSGRSAAGVEGADSTALIDAASKQPGYAGFLTLANPADHAVMGMSFWDSQAHLEASESGYYTREMDKSRDQFEGGSWTKRVYEVAAQA
jgi:heme-degrading monooxygenase HmoA